MRRDLRKYIDEYTRKYLDRENKTYRGQFYGDDFYQILEITGRPEKNRDAYLVWNALRAGFMVGYKSAKNEARRRSA